MSEPEVLLRVPGDRQYALAIRTALGGVAILKDLDADTLDDLRMAADEMCDCLLHQGRTVDHLEVAVYDEGDYLKVAISACYGEKKCPCEDETEITRAVLQTLASDVEMTRCGECVQCITLLLHKATAPLKSNDTPGSGRPFPGVCPKPRPCGDGAAGGGKSAAESGGSTEISGAGRGEGRPRTGGGNGAHAGN